MIEAELPDDAESDSGEMSYPHPGTISEETASSYADRYRSIRRRYSKQLGYVVENEELVEMMIRDRPSLAMRTWRVYKAAVLHALSKDPGPNHRAIERLASISSKGLPVRSARGAGRKLKSIPAHIAREIAFNLSACRALGDRERKYSAATANVLLATIRTGLRPSEWAGSALTKAGDASGEVLVLSVQNAKRNAVRANGAVREMTLVDWSQEELDVLQNALQEFRDNPMITARFVRNINRELKRSLDELVRLGRIHERYARITLYSARHQFAADAKSADLPYREVAALLGHKSQKTASWHYAPKRAGSGSVAVSPTANSVAAVSERTPRPRPVVR